MSGFEQIAILGQIVLIDLSLAGDNALVVGMAVGGLPSRQRRWATIIGTALAAFFRIICALFATRLLHLTGLTLAGGLLLLFVAWKLFHEMRQRAQSQHQDRAPHAGVASAAKNLYAVVFQIGFADLSMSIDNVLAVAGAAHGQMVLLAIGLALSVILTGFASGLVARLMARYHWLGYVGLAAILYTALEMLFEGMPEVFILLRSVLS